MYQISQELVEKYAVIGPRYTSYPTAPMWNDINSTTQRNWLELNSISEKALSLYIHIPFCRKRCSYCGCNVIVTRQQEATGQYTHYLLREIDSLGRIRSGNKHIRQLHFGGGTPNYLLNEEITRIFETIRKNFQFADDAEIGIEIDPSSTRPDQLNFLAETGFNRISFGVQDLDETVQQAVNRVQGRELTLEHLTLSRKLGIKGINFDLIYGLPFQSVESFTRTVEDVIKMRPDRLAVYNFGYLPERMIHQRKLKPETLPSTEIKLQILLTTINLFCDAGYRYIGMDHFALPEDELSIAQQNRTLYRNFMGYTPKSDIDLYGLGMTAISEFDHYFVQNEKTLKSYKDRIDTIGLAGSRGIELSLDDQIRKWVIMKLICHFYLDFAEFEAAFNRSFQNYFKEALPKLEEFEKDGLLEMDETAIKVVHHGQVLVRNICMAFDAYLNSADVPKIKYSKTL